MIDKSKVFVVTFLIVFLVALPIEKIRSLEGDNLVTRSYGGSSSDTFADIIATNDGGYLAAGYTQSNNGIFLANKGLTDISLVNLDNLYNVKWAKNYGGTNSDIIVDVEKTNDGGYVAAGYTNSNNGDITLNKGGYDTLIAKFDADGNKQWMKTYGGTSNDYFSSVVVLPDGDIMASGYTDAANGDITGAKGSYDGVLARFDSSGNKKWMKSIGSTNTDYVESMSLTNDGNLILAITSNASNGDFYARFGYGDIVISKYDTNGNKIWYKTIGGSKSEYPTSVKPTSDGGYITSAYSESTDNGFGPGLGMTDAYLIKSKSDGTVQWMRRVGGSNDDIFIHVFETPDGYFIASGYTLSNNGDILTNFGSTESLVAKFDNLGNKKWVKTYGGTDTDLTYVGLLNSKGDYLFAGNSSSPNISTYGSYDGYLYTIEGDHIPPSEITDLNESHDHESITLSWSNPTDSDFDHINLYRDGVIILSNTSNNYHDTMLDDGVTYHYKITTVDKLGNESLGSNINIKTTDITAPDTPKNIRAVGKNGSLVIDWDENTEEDLAGYNIYFNGEKYNQEIVSENHYEINGLSTDDLYRVSITAVDTSANESEKSEEKNGTIIDTIAPSIPIEVTAGGENGELTVHWKENEESDLDGYHVYLDDVKQNLSPIKENEYSISNLENEKVYKISVSSIDIYGNESSKSTELEVKLLDTIPPTAPKVTKTEFKKGLLKIWWENQSNENVVGYNIYLNKVKYNSDIVENNYFEIPNLSNNTTYEITISAVDSSYNESNEKEPVEVIEKEEPKDDGTKDDDSKDDDTNNDDTNNKDDNDGNKKETKDKKHKKEEQKNEQVSKTNEQITSTDKKENEKEVETTVPSKEKSEVKEKENTKEEISKTKTSNKKQKEEKKNHLSYLKLIWIIALVIIVFFIVKKKKR